MSSPAVFLDRDGTIIEDPGYVDDPEKVRLLAGAAEAIKRLRAAGLRVIIVSNQSGVARGLFGKETLAAVHERVVELLEQKGAAIDGAYYCPYLPGPEATVEAYRRDSELRKPRPGMLFQARHELDLDLARSWMVGDGEPDVEAGRQAGVRTILLRSEGRVRLTSTTSADYTVDNLLGAAEVVTRTMHAETQQVARDAAPTRPGHGRESEVVHALGRIHDQLERANRQQRQPDFSVLRLFGTLLQMIAIVAGLWGLVPLLGERPDLATARLMLACFLQLASISAFAIDRFR